MLVWLWIQTFYPFFSRHLGVKLHLEYISSSNNAGHLLEPSYDRDGPMHPNKEFNHFRLRDTTVVISPLLSVFDYVEQYPSSFDVISSPGM